MYSDIYSQRDKGMTFLTKGRDIFYNNKNLDDRELGYNAYKKGLEMLLQYLKGSISSLSALTNGISSGIQSGD